MGGKGKKKAGREGGEKKGKAGKSTVPPSFTSYNCAPVFYV